MRGENGGLRRLTNAEIAKNPQYGDFSLEQSKLSLEGFYDRMDEVMSPAPLDPMRAMKEAITALEEQIKTRVTAVENGRKFQNGGKGEASMPDGPAIFETSGPWEDFSTPARDFRLLIAIDVVRGYPDRVARRPERYAMPKDKSVADVKAELQSVLASELAARKFSYTRSDGSQWTLSLKDVLDRSEALEMSYNRTTVSNCAGPRRTKATKRRRASGMRRRRSALLYYCPLARCTAPITPIAMAEIAVGSANSDSTLISSMPAVSARPISTGAIIVPTRPTLFVTPMPIARMACGRKLPGRY